ncbi:hypothetical protein DFH09DRAFT_1349528, partial [Mycena vulgaris]
MSSVAYVEKVATEVWLSSFNHCDDMELQRLSLVCRYFRMLCQPLLFRTKSITAPEDSSVNGHNWIKLTQDMRRIAENLSRLASSTHAASVRVWRFWGNSRLDLPLAHPLITNIHLLQDAWLHVISTFTTTLGAYRSVTVLYLDSLTIDADFRARLRSLGLLEDLTFSDCNIVCRTGPQLPLKKFALEGWENVREEVDRLEMVSPNTLQALTLTGSTDPTSLLVTFRSHILPRLVDITIFLTTKSTRAFFACLDTCPVLESIHIEYSEALTGMELPTHLPSTTIPLLKSFWGPSQLSELFVRGRPVDNIWLARFQPETVGGLVSTLETLTQASAQLRVLTLAPSVSADSSHKIFAAIGSLFPELRALSTELDEEMRDVGNLSVDDELEIGSNDSDVDIVGIDNRTVNLSEGSIASNEGVEETLDTFPSAVLGQETEEAT